MEKIIIPKMWEQDNKQTTLDEYNEKRFHNPNGVLSIDYSLGTSLIVVDKFLDVPLKDFRL